MLHLRGKAADVVIDESTGAPTIVHWGAPLGDVDLASLEAAMRRPVVAGGLDVVAPISVVPEHGSGFQGRPGLAGHRRGGTDWSPRFSPAGVRTLDDGVVVDAVDPVALLRLSTEIRLGEWLSVRVALHNEGHNRFLLDRLSVTLPLPMHSAELLTFDGRWSREMQPVRRPWSSGAWTSENYAGRTSHEHPPLVFAGEPGFGEWHGEVWGIHLAWSGNHVLFADCMADGRRFVQAGELFHPGEMSIDPGGSYSTPELVAVYSGDGLTPATWGFHAAVRSSPSYPRTPRPVVLNTWEAVYFDHDLERLTSLASAAADLGVERFVLDDGWFGARRDDSCALGDWWVAPDVYPDGLAPLIDHVRGLGMEFGIWVEPEMVSEDSDLFRAHPEWALVTPGYEPVTGRRQLVLDLAQQDAFDEVLQRIDALLRDHDIAFVKWDMNRAHVQGSGAEGTAGTHAQTSAYYRLLDELRARHPSVEFESCASGGGRVDLGVLRRVERVWTSDCNDALERQTIQRGASMLVPPAVMGAHIGPTRSHTTGRVHSLAFRAVTAVFGHFGIEWDVSSLGERERSQLTESVALYRQFRALVHSGDSVRFDPLNGQTGASHAYGVYATDRREALVAHVQLTTGMSLLPPPLRLPGLDPAATYVVDQVPLPGSTLRWEASGIALTGRQLATHGVQLPAQFPETGLLLHLRT